MKITQSLLDNLTEQAKASPRLRMNMDLRNSAEDKSQRMLNAIEPESPLPIHRPNGPVIAVNIPIGQWHTVRSLESGTVILEVKDGAYEPLGPEDILA